MNKDDIEDVINTLGALKRLDADPEIAHVKADNILLEAIAAHCGDEEKRRLYDAWDAIEKWYA